MTALVDDKGWGGGWRQLFCAPDGRALAVFEQTVHVPDHEARFGLTITHILVIDRDAIAVSELPEAIRPAAAYYSERGGHWLVHGDLGRHHGLIIITSQPPYAVPERPLHSIDVVAMIDRGDGGLLLAGRRRKPTAPDSIRPTRLFELAAGATEPVPY
jgi:hypothetical protein